MNGRSDFECSLRPLDLPGLDGVLGVTAEMVREAEMSALLSDFARTLVTDFPIQGILDHLVGRITEVLPVTSAGVTLITPGVNPVYIAASDSSAMEFEALQTELGEGPCVEAFALGRPVSVANLADELRFTRFTPRALAAGLKAVFTFPLHQDDVCLGVLDLYRDSPGELSERDMEAAQTLADVAAAYLTNVQAKSDAHALAARYRESALHDGLTGLPNRLLLAERLQHARDRGRRSRTSAGMLFADLDHFKLVNDQYGHQIGDQLLIAVAHRLAALVRPGDTLARVSGDEFVILCEDLQAAAYVKDLAARIDNAFSKPFEVAGITISITASVGIAFAGRGEHLSEELMIEADVAMYQAKRKGGAGHQGVDLREAKADVARDRVRSDLVSAIAQQTLKLEYQPIVLTSTGQLTGVQALLRWTHPSRGQVPPQEIVAMAEGGGKGAVLGAWVIRRACLDRQAWMRSADSECELGVSVNVSTTQLLAPGFCDLVAACLTSTQTKPETLIVELTESVFLENDERAVSVLSDLKALGVAVSVVSFGTGYESLSYLKKSPVDIMKIDHSLVARPGHDAADTALFSAVVNLAHLLGFSVTAAGVQTRSQRDEVAGAGCKFSQGLYFAPATAASGIGDMLLHARDQPTIFPQSGRAASRVG